MVTAKTVDLEKLEMKDLYTPQPAEIVAAEDFTEFEKYFKIRMLGNGGGLGHQPGQFVQVSIWGYGEAPISISSSPTQEGYFELCVRRIGNLTSALHGLGAGAKVGIRGPYGKPFPIAQLRGQDLLIVAGGLGVIPLRSLINYVLDRRDEFGQVNLLVGVKSPREFLYTKEKAAWEKRSDINYLETVDRADESWKGHVGVITTLFKDVDFDPERTNAVVVGPPIMYKYAVLGLQAKGLASERIILSLERRMRCGVGKCGHCQINGKYVCQDGPTFSYAELRTLQEAFH